MKKIIIGALVLIASSCGSTEVGAPTTTEVKPEPVVIAAVGDISCSQSQRNSGKYLCEDEKVADVVRGAQADHLFLLGDIQYNSHTVKNFQANFGPIWSDLIPISKPIPGNHEYAEGGANGYYATWTNYPRPGYYSFSLNEDWFVVALNTNDNCSDVSCREGSEQYEWLKTQLEANKDKCIIAMAHHPRWSSGHHGSSQSVADIYNLMSLYGVQILLSGHDHHYERFNTSPKQFVVGTGGKDLRSVGSPIENSAFLYNDQSGALIIEIIEKTVSAKFVAIDGSVVDTDTTVCMK